MSPSHLFPIHVSTAPISTPIPREQAAFGAKGGSGALNGRYFNISLTATPSPPGRTPSLECMYGTNISIYSEPFTVNGSTDFDGISTRTFTAASAAGGAPVLPRGPNTRETDAHFYPRPGSRRRKASIIRLRAERDAAATHRAGVSRPDGKEATWAGTEGVGTTTVSVTANRRDRAHPELRRTVEALSGDYPDSMELTLPKFTRARNTLTGPPSRSPPRSA